MRRLMARSKSIDWDKQPLGEVSDVDLARRLGVHPVSVGTARSNRLIPCFAQPEQECARTRCANRLSTTRRGVLRDYCSLCRNGSNVARHREGVPTGAALQWRLEWLTRSRRVTTNWDKQPLGDLPDADLARKLGVRTSSVWSARESRHIPRFFEWCRVADELNTDTPDNVAKRFGVDPSTILRQVRRMGLPDFRRVCPCGTPIPQARSASARWCSDLCQGAYGSHKQMGMTRDAARVMVAITALRRKIKARESGK